MVDWFVVFFYTFLSNWREKIFFTNKSSSSNDSKFVIVCRHLDHCHKQLTDDLEGPAMFLTGIWMLTDICRAYTWAFYIYIEQTWSSRSLENYGTMVILGSYGPGSSSRGTCYIAFMEDPIFISEDKQHLWVNNIYKHDLFPNLPRVPSTPCIPTKKQNKKNKGS